MAIVCLSILASTSGQVICVRTGVGGNGWSPRETPCSPTFMPSGAAPSQIRQRNEWPSGRDCLGWGN